MIEAAPVPQKMFTKLLVVALAVLPLVMSTPTHCGNWKGTTQFRCAKDNYGADSIHIRNILNTNIRIGKWMSQCGWAGTNYDNAERYLGPNASTDEYFMESWGKSCNELFIFECKRNEASVNCVDVLTPSVN